jgi:hypothetical protein
MIRARLPGTAVLLLLLTPRAATINRIIIRSIFIFRVEMIESSLGRGERS